jgi:hypothetical protein
MENFDPVGEPMIDDVYFDLFLNVLLGVSALFFGYFYHKYKVARGYDQA